MVTQHTVGSGRGRGALNPVKAKQANKDKRGDGVSFKKGHTRAGSQYSFGRVFVSQKREWFFSTLAGIEFGPYENEQKAHIALEKFSEWLSHQNGIGADSLSGKGGSASQAGEHRTLVSHQESKVAARYLDNKHL